LILEEINVKNIEYIEELGDYVNYEVKPNFRVMGPKFGKDLKAIGNALRSMKPADVVARVKHEGKISIEAEGKSFELTEEDLDIRIQELEGFTFEMSNENFVILDTELTPELLQEGLAREMVSKIQTMRKEADFEITDRINVSFSGPREVVDAIDTYREYIKEETLSNAVVFEENLDSGTEWNLNGYDTLIRVQRV